MFHHQLKTAFNTAIEKVSSHISSFVKKPGRDLSRIRKLPASLLMSYLVSQGSSSTWCEVLDFFRLNADAPSASAFNQQKAKRKPEAMEELFNEFNRSVSSMSSTDTNKKFRTIATDGSTVSFFCRPTLRWFLSGTNFLLSSNTLLFDIFYTLII